MNWYKKYKTASHPINDGEDETPHEQKNISEKLFKHFEEEFKKEWENKDKQPYRLWMTVLLFIDIYNRLLEKKGDVKPMYFWGYDQELRKHFQLAHKASQWILENKEQATSTYTDEHKAAAIADMERICHEIDEVFKSIETQRDADQYNVELPAINIIYEGSAPHPTKEEE